MKKIETTINKSNVCTALVIAGIIIVRDLIITYYQHRCIRKTNNLEHENWKERNAITMDSEMEDDCE